MSGRAKILVGSAAGIALAIALLAVGVQRFGWSPVPNAVPPNAPAPTEEVSARPAENAAPQALPSTAEAAAPPSAPPMVVPFTWAASRQGNEIRFSGHVPSAEDRALLLDRVRRAIEGAVVVDEMTEAAGFEVPSGFAGVVRAAVGALVELRSGSVELSGRRLGVRGEALDKQALAAVEESFEDLPVGVEASAVSVTAAPVSPYRFAAQRVPGKIILSGYLPSAAARAEIAGRIGARFFHEQVVDQARLADGAPAGFAASAAFALDQLAQLATGEAAVTEEGVRVTGDMLYAQAAEQLRDRIARGAPNGARAFAQIVVRGPSAPGAEASP